MFSFLRFISIVAALANLSPSLQASNSSLSHDQELLPNENVLVKFHENCTFDASSALAAREKILVNGQSYRLSCVPGDMDCGLHSINAQYPHLRLTRAGILQRLNDVLDNPQDPHYNLVRRELSNDLISAIKRIFVDDFGISTADVDPDVFQVTCLQRGLTPFLPNIDFLRRLGADLFADQAQFAAEAYNNLELLRAHVRYLTNKDVLLLALPEDEGYEGTLGMLCRLYDVSISLVNYANHGPIPVRDFVNSRNDPCKAVLFRIDHFSPLCLMNDVAERDRLAKHHIREFILPAVFTYENVDIDPDLRSFLEKLAFDSKTYLRKYPHVVAEAVKAHVKPEDYAFEHFNKYRKAFPDLSDREETAPQQQPAFNAKRYLEKYPHVAAEAAKANANPEAYAKLHFEKYKAHFPNLSDK